ncbi:UNVERIFIED_CONTAM: NAD(P)H-quinone oxidoreductase subunit U, chloroplastic [Sesamum calycinum]|uniref:NAD(P)H-quinone oxidoreductase subunit U, chloroplastic n=1 Tax=Sesamum calycinum TaxID=2727403 RepID=A0AAW2J8X9_9LAMI
MIAILFTVFSSYIRPHLHISTILRLRNSSRCASNPSIIGPEALHKMLPKPAPTTLRSAAAAVAVAVGSIFEWERDVADMVEKVDSNGDGLIDFDEFCELFNSISGGGDYDAEGRAEGVGGDGDLKEAFDVFDGNKDGLNKGKKLEDCKEMTGKVDMDGDGMVNFDEFKKMMRAGLGRIIPVHHTYAHTHRFHQHIPPPPMAAAFSAIGASTTYYIATQNRISSRNHRLPTYYGAIKQRRRLLVIRNSSDESATATNAESAEIPAELRKDLRRLYQLLMWRKLCVALVNVAYKNKVAEVMNKGVDERELSNELDLLKESHSILSSVEERRLYDWSLARSGKPDKYMWPFEVDITQTPTDEPPPREPEDEGPTRLGILLHKLVNIILYIAHCLSTVKAE